MAKWPVQIWALLLALMGASLAVFALVVKTDATITHDVMNAANTLISGAIGAFAGHAATSSKADVTTGNGPTTINQMDPK